MTLNNIIWVWDLSAWPTWRGRFCSGVLVRAIWKFYGYRKEAKYWQKWIIRMILPLLFIQFSIQIKYSIILACAKLVVSRIVLAPNWLRQFDNPKFAKTNQPRRIVPSATNLPYRNNNRCSLTSTLFKLIKLIWTESCYFTNKNSIV